MSYAVGGAAKRIGGRRTEGVFGAYGDDEPPPGDGPLPYPTNIPGWTDIQDWVQKNVPGQTPGGQAPPGTTPPAPAPPAGPPQGSQLLGPDPDMTTLLAVGIAAVGVVAFVWVMRQ